MASSYSAGATLRLAASASLEGNSTLEHHWEDERGPQTCVGSSRFAALEPVLPLGDHGIHQPFSAGLWMAVPGALFQARGLFLSGFTRKNRPCVYIMQLHLQAGEPTETG